MNDCHVRPHHRAGAVLLGVLCVVLLVPATPVHAVQARGTILNRDGAAQSRCQVHFEGPATYDVWTNAEGAFYLENPAGGDYRVTVYQLSAEKGPRKTFDKVTVSAQGLSPSTLVVDW